MDAAENASPVDAVEALTRELGDALGATAVSVLIADLSGRALERLTHPVTCAPRVQDRPRQLRGTPVRPVRGLATAPV